MKIIKIHIIIVSLLLSGCASTYGPRNSMGGYEEEKLGKNMM